MTYNTNALTSNSNNTFSAGIPIEKVIGLRDKLDKITKKQYEKDKRLKRSHKKSRSKKYR